MRYLLLPLLLLACSDSSITAALQNTHEIKAPNQEVTTHRVVNGLTGDPIDGADLALVGTSRRARTNQDGAATLSGTPQHRWVRVRRQGFGGSRTRLGTITRLWPVVASEEAVTEYLRERARPPLDSDDLSDPDLTENARRRLAQSRGHGHGHLESEPVRYLKQGLQPPATIRIYRRGPENNSCQGRVDVIPLEDYVKGVVPHEWIPSWHDESLRAGSIAARGYAWGWILAGGKYDCADLDDTTRSQVYREDRTDRADAATDSTRGVGVIRDGEFVQSEYSAENGDPTEFGVDEPLCTGRERFGHGRGMCQWGTQRWATQRNQTAEWMVEHYYPGATTTNGAEPGGPQVTLRQRLERVEEVTCPDPGNMYDCADFVNQGWSRGLFDLFLEQSVTLSVIINNEGPSDAEGVTVGLQIPTPFLSLAVITTSGQITENSTAHYSVRFDRISAGGSQTIALELLGSEYSVPTGAPAAVHTWVSEITGVYEKADWDAEPIRNEGQTYNDGDLVMLSEFDIFDPRQWTWRSGDAAMLEGWISQPSATAIASERGLTVENDAGRVTIDSPYLPTLDMSAEVVSIDYESQRPVRLWWRREENPFSGDQVMVLMPGENNVSDGRLSDAIQLRIETNAPTTIRHLALLRSGTPVRDAFSPPQDTLTPEPDGSFEADTMGTLDAETTAPDPPPVRAPVRVKQVGGCHSMAHHAPSDLFWPALLLWFGFTRRRSLDLV